MAKESFEVSILLPTTPAKAYAAWLDSESHAAFTGASAEIDPVVGGHHMAWDGYIVGVNRELEAGRRILQSWRTSQFAQSDGDSLIELLFVAERSGTRLTLRHRNLPAGVGQGYEQGWQEHYFTPMLAWFAQSAKGVGRMKSKSRSNAKGKKKAGRSLKVKGKLKAKTPRKK
jgi:activator of HSP90 ATPase